MLKWLNAKRPRLDCGKHFFIIEHPRPKRGGASYQLEYFDTNGKRSWIRMDKNKAYDRESAYEEHLRLRLILAEGANIKEADTEVKTFSDGIPIYLRDRRADKIDSYKVIEQTFLNRFEPYFGDLRLKDITLFTVKKYRDLRRKTVEDVTLKRELGYLKEYFNLMLSLGHYVGSNPVDIKKLKLVISERERYMRTKEEAVIWPILPKYSPMEKLANFLYDTTMRPKNIINLVWPRIDWDKQEAFVPKDVHKNRTKDGHYMFNDETKKMLKEMYKVNQENGKFPYVFCRYECGKPKKITERWIQRMWDKIMEDVGIRKMEKEKGEEPLHFYDLKHTRLSRLAAAGANEFQLQAISNHKDPASLKKYVKEEVCREAARELLEKVDKVWGNNGVKTWSKK